MLLTELGARLEAQGVGIVGTDIFLSTLPPTPDTCLAVQEYGGSPAEETHDGSVYERPRVQVAARSLLYVTARTLAEAAYRALRVRNVTLQNTRYLALVPMQAPFLLRWDANNRAIVGFNVEAEKVLSVDV